MNEKLIRDYWFQSNRWMFPDFEVEIVDVIGGVVIFNEREPFSFGSFEKRQIDLLDVMAWLYKKINDN
jgi:hypothetical protein